MNIKTLQELLNNSEKVKEKLKKFLEERSVQQQKPNQNEIKGRIEKAEHNLRFVNDNLKLGYNDWCITGCYYAIYQAALVLINYKGYSSKSHDATLCILIKEYYKEQINKEEINLINNSFIDYTEIIFYVESKQKREDSSYSTKIKYEKQEVIKLRIQSALFVEKARRILGIK